MKQAVDHHNNFGFLRLLFAVFVIISHSAEIIDGNRSRELLTNIFGTLTLGELGVDSFFLISGYLVLQSFHASSSVLSYLGKRIRRIYPGFLVAYFVCICFVGPFVGVVLGALTSKEIARVILDAALLNPPRVPGFVGLPGTSLNGSMWSISVEFRCYLFVILFATIGIYRIRTVLVGITIGLLVLSAYHFRPVIPMTATILGDPYFLIRCLSLFCVGSVFYELRSNIPYRGEYAFIALCVLVLFMSNSFFSETAFALLGGYVIFWFALHFKSRLFQKINGGKDDISYGVYLYAWPIQSSIVYFYQVRSPWLLMALTIPISFAAGLASWRIVERPIRDYGRRVVNQTIRPRSPTNSKQDRI